MNEIERALLAIPARPVVTILEQLVAIRRQSKDDPEVSNPLITVRLRSGAQVTGWILDAFEGKDGRGVLLWQRPEPGQATYDGLYIDPEAVEAVTIHGLGECAHLLSFGAVPRPPAGTPLTRLEITRRTDGWLKDGGEPLASLRLEIAWESIPQTDDALWAVSQQVKLTVVALQQLAREKLGREAVRTKVKTLRFVKGDRAPSLEGDALVTGLQSAPDGKPAWSQDDVRAAIAAVL